MTEEAKTESTEAKTEETKTESTEVVEPFVSSSQSVSDVVETENEAFGKPKETESAEESSTEDKEESQPSETKSEESTEESDESGESKDNTQRRIDKLVAERETEKDKNRHLESRLEKLEQSKPEATKQEREFTSAEFAEAAIKAVKDDDPKLLADIFEQQNKQSQKDVVALKEKIDSYEETRKSASENNKEWQSIEKDYVPEAYNNDSDFDMSNKDSLLYRLAKQFFTDEDLVKDYQGFGGMRRAVQDAVNELLVNKLGSKEEKKEPKKITKVKIKEALGEGSDDSGITEKVIKPYSANDDLVDAIAERKKFKSDRVTTGV